MDFRLAVKAFIIKDKKVLLIKRRPNDPHKPGTWDIPGGRLEPGEDPYVGIKREVQEEITLDIDIISPIDIHHFTRDDGQLITMIIFLCEVKSSEIHLSEEHVEYKWQDISGSQQFPDWLSSTVKKFISYTPDKYR